MSILNDRQMSGFPVSIGTGLALETLDAPEIEVYDPSREVPPRVDITQYDAIFFNAKTILRNIFGSIPAGSIMSVTPDEYYACLKNEVAYLSDKFSLEDVESYVYDSDYLNARRLAPANKYRLATTEKQLFMQTIEDKVIGRLVKEKQITKVKDYVNFNAQRCIIFTHIPYDLTNSVKYNVMHLLESHTGVLKKPNQWGSKYYPIGDWDMEVLPFRLDLLIKFGDHVMFKPDPIDLRKKLYESLVTRSKKRY